MRYALLAIIPIVLPYFIHEARKSFENWRENREIEKRRK